MFAVIKTGGKQYKVFEGDVITIEKLPVEEGGDVSFDNVLMLGSDADITVGAPMITGARVLGEVVEQRKGEKVTIFKKRHRSTYRRKRGHRQHETLVTITSILAAGAKVLAKKAKSKVETVAEAQDLSQVKSAQATEAPKTAAPKAKAKAEKPVETKGEAPVESKSTANLSSASPDANGRLTAPQGDADNLKKLTGIGPALEKKLNAAGIYHFWQIAGLTEAQIESLETELSLSGRFAKDDWVAQAKSLI